MFTLSSGRSVTVEWHKFLIPFVARSVEHPPSTAAARTSRGVIRVPLGWQPWHSFRRVNSPPAVRVARTIKTSGAVYRVLINI